MTKKPVASVKLVGGKYRPTSDVGNIFKVLEGGKPVSITTLEKKFPDANVANRLRAIAGAGREMGWQLVRDDGKVALKKASRKSNKKKAA